MIRISLTVIEAEFKSLKTHFEIDIKYIKTKIKGGEPLDDELKNKQELLSYFKYLEKPVKIKTGFMKTALFQYNIFYGYDFFLTLDLDTGKEPKDYSVFEIKKGLNLNINEECASERKKRTEMWLAILDGGGKEYLEKLNKK